MKLSREAMIFAINEYRPKVVGHERAIQNVIKIRD
jgi:hypothetical protein